MNIKENLRDLDEEQEFFINEVDIIQGDAEELEEKVFRVKRIDEKASLTHRVKDRLKERLHLKDKDPISFGLSLERKNDGSIYYVHVPRRSNNAYISKSSGKGQFEVAPEGSTGELKKIEYYGNFL